MSRLHIGTKQVMLTPMTRLRYNLYRGWELPVNENGDDPGYLVEYMDGGKPNDPRHKGYISWSPKAQADAAYRPLDRMTFGDALIMLKAGHKVARAGWNGKSMFVFLIQGSNDLASLHGYGFGEYVGEPTFRDALFMYTNDGQLVPWTVSQSDALAEDWYWHGVVT